MHFKCVLSLQPKMSTSNVEKYIFILQREENSVFCLLVFVLFFLLDDLCLNGFTLPHGVEIIVHACTCVWIWNSKAQKFCISQIFSTEFINERFSSFCYFIMLIVFHCVQSKKLKLLITTKKLYCMFLYIVRILIIRENK